MARITPDSVNPHAPIDIAEVHSPADFENAAALQLCIQDAVSSESWVQSNYWALRWREADSLYQALSLDTLVRTKEGFKPIQDVHSGDRVFGKDGQLHKVIGESPVYENRTCYEIRFSTGERIVADAHHLWETVACQQTVGKGLGTNPNSSKRDLNSPNWKRGAYVAVRNTEELFATTYYGAHKKYNHRVKVAPALVSSETQFSVHPYTLGVWLGDGDKSSPRFTSADEEIVREVEREENLSSKKYASVGLASRYSFTNYGTKEISLEHRLRKIGVLENKHIPLEYLNGSRDQRLALLQGLLDTDGSCSKDGSANFRNTNYSLALGVKQLVCSLGWRASLKCYEYDRYTNGKIYSVHFTPDDKTPVFRLARKGKRQQPTPKKHRKTIYRSIVSIEKVPSVPVKCLSVEGEFYLITDGLIATHNSPPSVIMWEGTTVPRANVNRWVVAETVNAIHPQIINGLFYEQPAFILRPRPGQNENTTRAISALLSVQFSEMKFREETDWLLSSALLFGTGIGKWGYKSYTKKIRKYIRSGEPVKVPSSVPGMPDSQLETPESLEYERMDEEKAVHCPFFENKDVRYILVEPGARTPDIRNAKFVIDRMYMTYRDLIKLKEEEYTVQEGGKKVTKKRYILPSEEEIKSWFEDPKDQPASPGTNEVLAVQGTTSIHHAKPRFEKTTADPLDEPLEVLERWDNDKVITVLNRIKCIRNEANEFGIIPFLSVNWWNIPDAFWGLGLGRVIGAEQRVQQGIINACLDLASLIVNPMFVTARGANVQTQEIRQRIGGIVRVDIGGERMPKSTKEALSLLEQPHIPGEVVQQIALSEARVERTSGANQQLTMGASSQGHSQGQIGRSAAGASGMIQATMNRIGGFAEAFVRQIYEPLLYQMHELNRDKTPIPYIREVLGKELGESFTFDPTDFKNAPAEFEVLAGSHLAAKAQMAQSLFMMIQLFENQPLMDQLNKISKKKVNVEELFHMVHDISGWKNYYDIIQDLSPEEIQAQQAQNPALQKMQSQMALKNQQFGQDQQLIDQENEARTVRDIFRQIAEKSAEPQALLGEVPTQGVGSQEVG